MGDEQPIAKGELWKKSDDEGKFWKKRFIKLYSSHLTYAVNEYSEILGEMRFTEEYFLQDASAPTGKFGFIVTDFNTVHRLAAESKDVKEFWCHTITTVIREKLNSAHYFDETRKLVQKVDEDEADKEDEKKLQEYYKHVNRPKARQDRSSFIDFRAAQVYAEAQEAAKEAEAAKATEWEKKEAERLAEMAKTLQDQVEVENPPTSVVVLSGIKEEPERDEQPAPAVPDNDKFRPISIKIPKKKASPAPSPPPQVAAPAPVAKPAPVAPPPVANPSPATPQKSAVASEQAGGISSRVGAWNDKLASEQEKQANNVFSKSFQGKKPIDKDAYGKAPEGSVSS